MVARQNRILRSPPPSHDALCPSVDCRSIACFPAAGLRPLVKPHLSGRAHDRAAAIGLRRDEERRARDFRGLRRQAAVGRVRDFAGCRIARQISRQKVRLGKEWVMSSSARRRRIAGLPANMVWFAASLRGTSRSISPPRSTRRLGGHSAAAMLLFHQRIRASPLLASSPP
jgi:hypothetical protein